MFVGSADTLLAVEPLSSPIVDLVVGRNGASDEKRDVSRWCEIEQDAWNLCMALYKSQSELWGMACYKITSRSLCLDCDRSRWWLCRRMMTMVCTTSFPKYARISFENYTPKLGAHCLFGCKAILHTGNARTRIQIVHLRYLNSLWQRLFNALRAKLATLPENIWRSKPQF